MPDEKMYCGSAKIITAGDFNFMKLSIPPSQMKAFAEYAEKNGGWGTIKIMRRKEPSPKGDTHYGLVDTWKPQK